MSRATAFNSARWLTRMGFKGRADEPEIVYGIQPTQLVSDASRLTPAMIPPSGMIGGVQAALVNEFGYFELVAVGPGGMWVDELRFNRLTGIVLTLGFRTNVAPLPAVTGPTNLVVTSVFEGAPECIGRVGTVAIGTEAVWNLGARPQSAQNDPIQRIFVPSGQVLTGIATVAAVELSMLAMISEPPAPRAQ